MDNEQSIDAAILREFGIKPIQRMPVLSDQNGGLIRQHGESNGSQCHPNWRGTIWRVRALGTHGK